MLKADDLVGNQAEVNGRWVVAKPLVQPLPTRIKDAIQVIKGKAEAVVFEKQ